MAGGRQSAVLAAVIGNGILIGVKGAAFLLSGSGAMLSEAIHSVADTTNQLLLYLGVRRSARGADEQFPYGYGAERYLFALISAVGIFILGAGVTVYHGVHSLLVPPELTVSWIDYAVLAAAGLIEGFVLLRAAREVAAGKGSQSFLEYLKSATDPTVLAVLFEDSVAVAGVVVAGSGIALSAATGSPIYDSVGSIVIGLLLAAVAVWLGLKNRDLILGRSIPPHLREQAVALIMSQPSVVRVQDVKTLVIGADRFKFKAEVDFDGGYIGRKLLPWVRENLPEAGDEAAAEAFAAEFGDQVVQALADEIDRIEGELAPTFPRLHHVDLEAD
ncbi:MAG: cation diffusion facilitator family transporter [Deltaproteobacteria bacterium]|nr:cation diffusion facilitator family transporter [Deltaproteobacteria bacterium]